MNLQQIRDKIWWEKFRIKNAWKDRPRQKYWDKHGIPHVAIANGLIVENCPFSRMPYHESVELLRRQHLHDDGTVILAIDNIIVFYYTELPSSQRGIVSDLIMGVKNHPDNYGTYTVGDAPFKGIYADVIGWQSYWAAQVMFGGKKRPNLIAMLSEESLKKWKDELNEPTTDTIADSS